MASLAIVRVESTLAHIWLEPSSNHLDIAGPQINAPLEGGDLVGKWTSAAIAKADSPKEQIAAGAVCRCRWRSRYRCRRHPSVCLDLPIRRMTCSFPGNAQKTQHKARLNPLGCLEALAPQVTFSNSAMPPTQSGRAKPVRGSSMNRPSTKDSKTWSQTGVNCSASSAQNSQVIRHCTPEPIPTQMRE